MNALHEENESLRKENEEYEKESEDMQTKINVLYNEAKKHMSSTEWEKFIRRIIEREEELVKKYLQLKEDNEQLLKDVENLQEVVAELGATLLLNGFEIEINGENLSELIDDE